MPATPTVAPAEPGAREQSAPARRNRFINASGEHTEPFYDSGNVSAGVELANIEVPASGYLSGILLDVEINSSGNSAAVTNHEDGPFSAVSSFRLADVNGANLVGPVGGFDLCQINKYGGYAFGTDPRDSPNYTLPTVGAGATAGTGRFHLRIPVQVNPRDAYGSLPNMNAASTFKMFITINALAGIFGVVPNGTVTFRVRATLESWLVPASQDALGVLNEQAPPGVGSYQRWVKNVFTIAAGAQTLRLPNVSNMIRTLLFTFRNTTPARNDSNFPSDLQLMLDGYARYSFSQRVLRQYQFERSGFTGTDIETGVFVIDYTHELDGKQGFETRELWLPTNSATRLELVGTFGAAGTLEVLTNDVIPVGGDYRSA